MLPTRSDPKRDIRVCFVGDPFVAGVGDSSGLGWTGRVVASAAASAMQLTSYNLGIRRQTSRQIVDRLSLELPPRLDGQTDPRVVMSFGVNDCTLELGSQRLPPNETRLAMLDAIATVHPLPLLVVGPPPVHGESPDQDESPNRDGSMNQRIEATNDLLQSTCRSSGVPYLSVFEDLRSNKIWRAEVAAGDGAHPDSAGYAELFKLIEDDLLSWLRHPAAPH